MDPQYQYNGPQEGAPQPDPQSVDPNTDVNAEAQSPETDPSQGMQPQDPNQDQDQAGEEPSGNPQDPGYVMGDVNDGEIDQTLDGYGQWEDDDGTRVWVPDTTQVGMDFMPYDTDGSWVWSDAGWAFTCGYSWGWLPFHYGRWGWFHNHWGWVPGHKWGAAWVDWRHGNGLVGWRPMGPGVRGAELHDSHWNFVHENALGAGHIAGHLTVPTVEGLRGTQGVAHLPTRGNYTPVASASIMRGRLGTHSISVNNGIRSQPGIRSQSAFRNEQRANQPTWRQNQPTYRGNQPTYRQPAYRPSPSFRSYGPSRSYGPARAYRPSYSAPSRSYSNHSSYSSHSSFSSHSSGGGGHSGGGGRHR